MPLTKNFSIKEYQEYIDNLYKKVDQMHFNDSELLINADRFLMRGLKGIRKEDEWKIEHNLLITLGFYSQLASIFDIDIEDEVWKRFPDLCSYCQKKPCACTKDKKRSEEKTEVDNSKRPKNFSDFQKMLSEIYPPQKRSLFHAGIHLAEEMGELVEAHMIFRRNHGEKYLNELKLEIADLFSCIVAVFASLNKDLSECLLGFYKDGCNGCHKEPCVCSFDKVITYKS